MVAQVDVGTVGTPVNGTDTLAGNIAQGIQYTSGTTTPDQFGTLGTVNLGHDGVPIGTFLSESSVGNAVTIDGFTDLIADVVDGFTISWIPLGGGATTTRTLTAGDFAGVGTLAQLVAVIDAIDVVTARIDFNGDLQITSPFLTQVTDAEFSSSTGLAAGNTTVDITGITDDAATSVGIFTIAVGGSVIDTSGLDFSGVTNRAELAAVLDALPSIAVTESAANGGTITITSDASGPSSFTDILLGDLTLTAATARLAADDLATLDALVASAESFVLQLNGSFIDFSSLDFFTAITTAADLAAALDAMAGISAQLVGSAIDITSDALGSGNAFSDLRLVDNQAFPATAATVSITDVDSFAGVATAFSLLIDGLPVDTSSVDFAAAVDGASLAAELDGIAGITVSYSADNGGTLVVTADAPGAETFSDVSLTRPNAKIGSDGVDDNLTGDVSGTLIQGLGGNDTLTGLSGEDQLEGGPGNDTLDGGAGDDILDGGSGDDLLMSDAGSDSYDGGDGIDTVSFANVPPVGGVFVQLASNLILNDGYTPVSETILNVENVIGSAGGDVIRGTTGANTIDGGGNVDFLRGDAGDDILIGGELGDELDGGDDNDTAQYNTAVIGGMLVIDLTNPSNNTGEAAGDSYISIENITGSNGNDLIRGDGFANTLSGRDGNDLIEGGAGADRIYGGPGQNTLRGGSGDDWYYVSSTSDAIFEGSGEGAADRVFASVTYRLRAGSEVEILQTTDNRLTDPLKLIGNELANMLIGNAGDNALDGGGGVDRMYGFGGNDSYIVDSVGDLVFEDADAGLGGSADRVLAAVSYTLAAGAGVETLQTTNNALTTALSLTGNEFANTIIGNAGDNTLNGGGGADALFGFGGNDSYFVDNAADVVNEDANAAVGGSNDRVLTTVSYTLKAGSGVETLQTTNNALTTPLTLGGNELANTIIGNAGDNVLNGGAGKDTLFGLGGADTFLFNTALDTAPGTVFSALPATANVDFIGDFDPVADTIQLEDAIFIALGTTPAGPGGARVLTAGAFNTGAGATEADDRIIYNAATGVLLYDADGSGAGAAREFAMVNPNLALTNADFWVI